MPVQREKWFRIIALMACFCFVFAFAERIDARTADSVGITTVVGFNGVVRTGTWTPVSIILENQGIPLEDGTLEITVTRGDEFNRDIYQTRYRRTVDLPGGSRKIYRFNILIETHLHPITITLYRNKENILFKQLDIRQMVTQKPILLMTGRAMSSDFPDIMSDRFKPAVVHALHLPYQWQGYQGVGAFFLSADNLSRLEPSQAEALVKWVESGGTLISAGSINTSIFSSDRVRKVLQVIVKGVKKMDSITSMAEFCGEPKGPASLWVNLTRMDDAIAILSQDGMPLILLKKIKDGRILFVSFDTDSPTFSKYRGKKGFWQAVLSHVKAPVRFPDLPDDMAVADLLMENSRRIFPGLTIVLSILGPYILLLAVILKDGRAQNQKRKVHVMLLGVVIFLFTGLGVGVYVKQTDYRVAITLTKAAAGRTKLSREIYTGVYSPKAQKKRVDLGFQSDPIQVIFPSRQARTTWLESAYFLEKGRHFLDLNFGRFNVFHYKTIQRADCPFSAQIKKTHTGISLTLENLSGTPVKNSFLTHENRVYFIGDIPADACITFSPQTPVIHLKSGVTIAKIEELKTYFSDRQEKYMEDSISDAVLETILTALYQLKNASPLTMTLAGMYDTQGVRTDTPGPGWLLWQMPASTGNNLTKGGETG